MKTLKQWYYSLTMIPYNNEQKKYKQATIEWLTEKKRILQQQKTLYYPTTYQTKENTYTELINELEEQQ